MQLFAMNSGLAVNRGLNLEYETMIMILSFICFKSLMPALTDFLTDARPSADII